MYVTSNYTWPPLLGVDQANKEENMSLVSKLKDLTRNKDDKLLIKHGVLRRDGDVSDEGESLLLAILFDEYKATVVEKVKQIAAAEKKEQE